MAEYRIVCVERLHAHWHITHVGTGATAERATQQWTVAQVRTAIADGDAFYTVSPSTGKIALVLPIDAWVNGRLIQTIRSHEDAVWDNNLDQMRVCAWQAS